MRRFGGGGGAGTQQQQQHQVQNAVLTPQQIIAAQLRRDNAEQQAIRNGLAQMWLDEANALFSAFSRERALIQLFVDRREAQEALAERQQTLRAERRWGELEATKRAHFADERERRSKLTALEERTFAAIVRLRQCDYAAVEIGENLRKLMRNESNKRYLLERAEERAFSNLASLYGLMDWKPTLKILGTCPFESPAQCPFHKGNCYGLQVAPTHFARVDVVVDASPKPASESGLALVNADTVVNEAAAVAAAARVLATFHKPTSPISVASAASPRKRRLKTTSDPMDTLMASREADEEALVARVTGTAVVAFHPFDVSISELTAVQLRSVP